MSDLFLGIGGNRGNMEKNFKLAYPLIEKHLGMIKKRSSVYETSPWGFKSNNNFLNQVLLVESTLDPNHIIDRINEIERALGRKHRKSKFKFPLLKIKPNRVKRYRSRPIDIDILYYDDLVINTEKVTIPHPRLAQRLFVLIPLAEIAPDKRDPLLKRSIKELLNECSDNSIVTQIDTAF